MIDPFPPFIKGLNFWCKYDSKMVNHKDQALYVVIHIIPN